MNIEFLMSVSCLVAGAAFFSLIFGQVVFAPIIEDQINEPGGTSKFRMIDLLILMAQIQISIGLIVVATKALPLINRVAAILIWGALLAFWWFLAVRMATGVRMKSGYRQFFIGVLSPLGFSISLSLIALPVWFVIGVASLTLSLQSPSRIIYSVGILACLLAHLGLVRLMIYFCKNFAMVAIPRQVSDEL